MNEYEPTDDQAEWPRWLQPDPADELVKRLGGVPDPVDTDAQRLLHGLANPPPADDPTRRWVEGRD
jgi:hypothetical protein